MKTAEEILESKVGQMPIERIEYSDLIEAMEEYALQFKGKTVNELKSNVSPLSEAEKSWYCLNANSGFGRCDFQCGKCKMEQQGE